MCGILAGNSTKVCVQNMEHSQGKGYGSLMVSVPAPGQQHFKTSATLHHWGCFTYNCVRGIIVLCKNTNWIKDTVWPYSRWFETSCTTTLMQGGPRQYHWRALYIQLGLHTLTLLEHISLPGPQYTSFSSAFFEHFGMILSCTHLWFDLNMACPHLS